MKLTEFIKKLQKLEAKYGDFDIMISEGGEGISCQEVTSIEVGWIDEENDYEFVSEDQVRHLVRDGDLPDGTEADCILVS
jgi:hypothetical protein